MSIWTTPEREQLRKTVRAFAEREILPHVDEYRDMRIIGIGGGTTEILTALAAKTLGFQS